MVKNCVWAQAECQMYQMHWKFGKAAPNATNINFLNFCSNCQVAAEKIARFKKVCVRGIFPLSFPFFSRRISEPGNQINSKIDMCIVCCSKKNNTPKWSSIVFERKIYDFYLNNSEMGRSVAMGWAWAYLKCSKIR